MSELEDIFAFVEKVKKDAVDKAKQDTWINLKKDISKIKIGICFAIVSPFLGLAVGFLYMHFLHKFAQMIELFK